MRSFIILETDSGPTRGHVSKKHIHILPKGNKKSAHLLVTLINKWPTSISLNYFNPTCFSPGNTLRGTKQKIRLLLGLFYNDVSVNKFNKLTDNLTLIWSSFLPEKLTYFQLVQKFPVFYVTQSFVTFARTNNLFLSGARSIQTISLISLLEDLF
jgi:hypothetical protein